MRKIFVVVTLMFLCAELAHAEAAGIKPAPVGEVEGVVTFDGAVPKNPIADDGGKRRDLLTVDVRTRGVQFVVAHLEPEKPSDATNTPAANTAVALRTVLVDQRDHTFAPHLVAVRAGQTVVFTNSDPANHNVRATSPEPKNGFNVFTGVSGEHRQRFVADPKNRPVRLDCDIHPWMRGWICVFDHAAFAATDAEGKFSIRSVPPGRYRLIVRQPDIRYQASRPVIVKSGETTRLDFKITEAHLKRGETSE